MGLNKKSVDDINVKGLRVLCRCDFNVPLKDGKITEGEKINVVVPTGNFGNILAAFYAKNMGLPIDKLICASNDLSLIHI